jgi:hypothetical protein
MSRAYTQVFSGEWVQPVRKGYKMGCCDCGLVHTVNFRIVKRRIQFQAFRDERKTAAHRRERKKKKELNP